MTGGKRGKLAVICAGVLLLSAGCMQAKGCAADISGRDAAECFAEQKKYVDDLSAFASSLDDVVTLYLTGAIGKEDLLVHTKRLRMELDLLKAAYKSEMESQKIRPGTETYATLKGSRAVEELFSAFGGILDMLSEEAGYPERLSYRYLASHQVLIDILADYVAAAQEEEK